MQLLHSSIDLVSIVHLQQFLMFNSTDRKASLEDANQTIVGV